MSGFTNFFHIMKPGKEVEQLCMRSLLKSFCQEEDPLLWDHILETHVKHVDTCTRTGWKRSMQRQSLERNLNES